MNSAPEQALAKPGHTEAAARQEGNSTAGIVAAVLAGANDSACEVANTSVGVNDSELRMARLLAAADAARGAKQWAVAAENYRSVLELDPNAAPIWVQYGHMLKESGNKAEASIAYDRALALDPKNADTHLQIGHLLKITNKKLSAIEMYSKALELDPAMREAERELRALGVNTRADDIILKTKLQHLEHPGFYFDISDLIYHHFPSNRSPTGIQRIVLAIAEAALEGDRFDVGLCVLEPESGRWKLVDRELALHLMMLSHEGAGNSEEAWKSALGDVHRAILAAAPFVFPRQSIVVSLGAPWGIRGYFAAIREAKRQSGIRCVGYVHDTVPLLYPEYCDGVIPEEFLRWLRRLTSHADLMLANSHSTKRDFVQALTKLGCPVVNCEVVYPNGDFASLFRYSETLSPEVQALAGTNYVLFVGTVQPRKNHLMVLSGWRRLINELGPDKVPTLVLVGKLGWYWEQVIEYIRKTDNLGGKLKMLNKASDADLYALYEGARFTLYNSHYEGWGLPVTESLSFGKVPVIARNSALLESGGKYAIFYDTNSEPSFVETIRRIIQEPSMIADREEVIRADAAVRPWREVFKELRDVVEHSLAARGRADAASERSRASLGRVYQFGQELDKEAYTDWEIVEDVVRVGADWHDPEDWGVWTRSERFEMSFDLDLEGQVLPSNQRSGDLFLFLHLRGHRQTGQLQLSLNGMPSRALRIPSSTDTVVRIAVAEEILQGGRINLRFQQKPLSDLERLTGGADRRTIGVGVKSLMFARESDIQGRLAFLEAATGYNTVNLGVPLQGGFGTADEEDDGGFLRLGGQRADVAHAPEKLVEFAKSG